MEIRFDIYSPQVLRDEIQVQLLKNSDPITASYLAIESLNQRYGVTDMKKASQLKTGQKVESEHKETVDFIDKYFKEHGKIPPAKEIEKHIAENHINGSGGESGIKDYYTRLLAMEDQAKRDKKRSDIEIEVIKFLIKNPNPSDAKVHRFSERIGINTHKLEDVFYKLATERAEMSKDMQKARVTKYIMRIPKPTGKGYYYFYTRDQVNAYKKDGTIPEQSAEKGGSWINTFMGFFGFAEENQAKEKVKADYTKGEVKEKFGLSLGDWSKHISEYFGNKVKWDTLFLKKLEAQKKVKTTTGANKKEAIGSETKIATTISGAVKKVGLNHKAMYFIFNYYKEEKKNEQISSNTKNGVELPAGTVSAIDDSVHSGETQGTAIANVPEAKPSNNGEEHVLSSDNSGVRLSEHVRLTKGQVKALRKQVLDLLASKTNEEMTDEDKALLRRYEGGGGTKEEGLTDEEMRFAFYTPQSVVDKVWQIVDKYIGAGKKNVLEPSAGSGRFAENKDHNFTMFELDPTSARINKILHPEAEVIQGAFETNFLKGGMSVGVNYAGKKFDVTVGNPPYGEYSGMWKGRKEGVGHTQFEEYFMDRALDALEDGGIMAYVVPSGFLRGDNLDFAKKQISGKGRLLEAYRLPNGTFSTTTQGTDIVIIRKETGGDSSDFIDDNYFKKNPDHIMGDVSIRSGKYGPEQFVKLLSGTTLNDALNAINTNNVPVIPYQKAEMSDDAKANIALGMKGNKNAEKNIKSTKEKIEKKSIQPVENKTGSSNVDTTESFNAKYNRSIDPKEISIWKHTSYKGTIDTGGLSKADKEYLETSDNICIDDNGDYIHKINYASGKVRQKLELLEEQREKLGEKRYLNQKAILESAIPPLKTVKNFTISPISQFAKDFKFISEDNPEGLSLKDRFLQWATGKTYAYYNMDWRGGVTQHDLPSGISWSDIMHYLDQDKVSVGKTGDSSADQARAAKIKELRRNVTEKLFKRFLETGLNPEEENQIEKTWNGVFNSWVDPDYQKIPVSVDGLSTTFKGGDLVVQKPQLMGVSRLSNKGNGLLAYDVGVGKTLTGILATIHQLQTGKAKKPLICVPKAVYTNWIKEIKDLFPDIKLNELGNMGANFVSSDLNIPEGTLSIMTYEGLGKIGFSDETVNSGLLDDMVDAQSWEKEGMTKLEEAGMRAKIKEMLGKATATNGGVMLSVTADNGSSFDVREREIKNPGGFVRAISGLRTKSIPAEFIKSAFEISGKNFIVIKEGKTFEVIEVSTGLRVSEGDSSIKAIENTIQTVKNRNAEDPEGFNKLVASHPVVLKESENNFETMPDVNSAKIEEGGAFFIEQLGFDHITVDEIHHFKNIFTAPRPGKDKTTGKEVVNEFAGLTGGQSAQGLKMFALTQFIQANNNDRNIFGLSATPFTNSPLEIYNILALMARQRLKDLGLYNLHEFMATFAHLKNEWAVQSSGKVEKKMVMKEFQNLGALQSLIQEYISKVDKGEAGVVVPHKNTHFAQLNMSPLQKKIMEVEMVRADLANPKNAGLTAGMDKAMKAGATLVAINNMRMATLSPKLLKLNDPLSQLLYSRMGIDNIEEMIASEDFIEDSPKLKFSCEVTAGVYEKRPDMGQVLYVPRGIEEYDQIIKHLVKQGIPRDAIATISSKTSSTEKPSSKNNPEGLSEKDRIMRDFNDPNGKIKIIIGSETIQEGVNLNGNTAVLNNTLLGWNPTETVQVEGRIERQGNMQDEIHIIYPQLIDSVDASMYQKHDEKRSRFNDLWSYKGDMLNVEEIDPEKLKFDLIKDPVRRAEYDIDLKKEELENKKRDERIEIDTLKQYKDRYHNSERDIKYKEGITAKLQEEVADAEKEVIEIEAKFKEFKKLVDKSESNYDYMVAQNERRIRSAKDDANYARKALRDNAKEIELEKKNLIALSAKLNDMATSISDIDTRIAQKEKIVAEFFEQETALVKDKDKFIEQARIDIEKSRKTAPSMKESVKNQVDLIIGNLRTKPPKIVQEMAKAIKIFYNKMFNPETAEFEYKKIITRI